MFELSAQRAIYEALKNSVPLSELVEGIFDDAPQSLDSGSATAFPYVTIGEASAVEFDTDTTTGAILSCVIHVWDRSRNREIVKEIQGQIYQVLNRAKLTVFCYDTIDIHFINSSTFLDADGKTRHGVQTFELMVAKQISPNPSGVR